jgi:hypothetical protein
LTIPQLNNNLFNNHFQKKIWGSAINSQLRPPLYKASLQIRGEDIIIHLKQMISLEIGVKQILGQILNILFKTTPLMMTKSLLCVLIGLFGTSQLERDTIAFKSGQSPQSQAINGHLGRIQPEWMLRRKMNLIGRLSRTNPIMNKRKFGVQKP